MRQHLDSLLFVGDFAGIEVMTLAHTDGCFGKLQQLDFAAMSSRTPWQHTTIGKGAYK